MNSTKRKRIMAVDEVELNDLDYIVVENENYDLSEEYLEFDLELGDLDEEVLELLEEELENPEEELEYSNEEELEDPEEELEYSDEEELEDPDEEELEYSDGEGLEDSDEKECLKINDGILTQFKPCNVPNRTRKVSATGSGITIVKANTGNRLVINRSIVETLGITTEVQFGYSETGSYLMVGKGLPNDFNRYNVRIQKNKSAIVYNKELITDIATNFGLDFTNCSSQTFSSWKVEKQENVDVVVVDIR